LRSIIRVERQRVRRANARLVTALQTVAELKGDVAERSTEFAATQRELVLKSKSQRLELLTGSCRKLSARHSARLRGESVTHDNDLDDTDDDS
jgi:hypothetical protein